MPLHTRCLSGSYTLRELHDILARHYQGQTFVKVMDLGGIESLPEGFLAANTLAGTNMMEIYVCGNDDRALIAARLDNLGKGASGAAVQCMNIMMGINETAGLL